MDDAPELDPVDRWLAANLKAAREQAGLSQETVAQRMRERGFPGFRQQTIGRIEAGERGVQFGEALSLARCVSVPVEDLGRAPELTHDAMVLRGATGRLVKLRDEAARTARQEAEARERLASLVARLRAEGKAEALAGEIARAGRVLATAGDEGPEQAGAVSGPSGSAP